MGAADIAAVARVATRNLQARPGADAQTADEAAAARRDAAWTALDAAEQGLGGETGDGAVHEATR